MRLMTNIAKLPDRTGPSIRSLLVINAALLCILAVVTLAPAATAQGRVRGDYTMVGGGANGANSSLVYVIDAVNQEMIAVMYDTSNKNLTGVGYRNLAGDARSVLRAQTPGR